MQNGPTNNESLLFQPFHHFCHPTFITFYVNSMWHIFLGYVEATHVKAKDVAQPIRLSGCQTKGHFWGKNAFLVFFALKWPFVGQPVRLVGWATSLTYTLSVFYLPKDHFLKFWWKMFRNDGFEKLTFFETTKFQYSKFRKNSDFFALFLFKCLINS